jgi:hypothetical protein
MNFDPINPLEESLVKASENVSHRPQFYRDLLEAEVFLIQKNLPETPLGQRTLEKGEEVQLVGIHQDGRNVLPFFSSLPRLQAVIQEEMGYLMMKGRQLFELTQGSELVLNPGADYGKEFTAVEVAALLDGSLFSPGEVRVSSESTEVMIGRPQNYPQEFVSALAQLFPKHPEVTRAYLAHYFNPQTGPRPHTLVAIECDKNWERVVTDAGIVVQNVSIPDPPVDFIRLDPMHSLASYFKKEKPIYKKKKFFGLF